MSQDRRPDLQVDVNRTLERSLRLAFAVCLASIGVLAGAPALAREEQPCDLSRVERALVNRLPIKFPEGEDRGDVIDLVCKPHPTHRHLTIVAMFHVVKDAQGERLPDRAGFVTAVFDARRGGVESFYQDTVEEDASIRVRDASLWLDTARYDLAAGVRAFGVRMDIGYGPRCADGGESQYLTLFVANGTRLRPVLKSQPMWLSQVLRWSDEPDTGACTPEVFAEANLSLSLGRTASKGWQNLDVTATIQFDPGTPGLNKRRPKVRRVATLRYDGEQYIGDASSAARAQMGP